MGRVVTAITRSARARAEDPWPTGRASRPAPAARMHELAVTQARLDVALRHAAAAGARRVTEIHVVLGDLASVVDDCVAFYWDEFARGTACEGARLRFERVPARMRCEDCSTEFGVPGGLTACPGCDGVRLRVLAGEECRLESLSVETPLPEEAS